MSISRVGRKTSSDAERAVIRPRLEPRAFDILPAELWSTIASYFDKEALKNLSRVSRFDRAIALRALNIYEMNASLSELQGLCELNPIKPLRVVSTIDFYRDVLDELQSHVQEIPLDQQKRLHQKLTALSIDQVAKEFLVLTQECYKDIEANIAFFKDIEQRYLTKRIFFVGQALNTIADSSLNPEFFRGFIVKHAAAKGHLEILKMALEAGSIDEEHRGEAVTCVAGMGHLEIVQALLASGAIDDDQRSLALVDAVSNSHLSIVKTLLASGMISGYLKAVAIQGAARKESLEIVLALSGSEEETGYALTQAALYGHQQIVVTLLNTKPIDEQFRGQALSYAAKYGYKDIVKILLDSGYISKEYLDNAAHHAKKSSNQEIIALFNPK
jgi:hypothetical protein